MNSQAGGFLPVRWNDVLDADLKGQQMTDMMDNWKQKELWTRRAR
jgi:hypothetical protein